MSTALDLATVADQLAWLMTRASERGYAPPVVLGISTGGCREAHGTPRQGAMRRSAHAHCDPADEHRGWLCFKAYGREHLRTGSGLPSVILRHEYAHLMASDGHGARWQRAVAALGAPGEAKRHLVYAAAMRARRRS